MTANARPPRPNSLTSPLLTSFHFAMMVVLLALGSIQTQSASAQTFSIVHAFPSFDGDGVFPHSPLLLDPRGKLYGTTLQGGNEPNGGYGTVFALSKNGEDILFSFDYYADSGAYPTQPLLRTADGTLYGTADSGSGGSGVVFALSPQGDETVLYSFQGGQNSNPKLPSSGVIMDAAGNLYGTTASGGNSTCNKSGQPFCGTVYRLDKSGKLTVIHSFTGGPDGAGPSGNLIMDKSGNLYGVTSYGGDAACPLMIQGLSGCGVIFKIDQTGKETVLYAFKGGSDGAAPTAGNGLLMDSAGNLYGVAQFGGEFGQACEVAENRDNYGCGTIYKLASNGKFTVLHEFNNDGSEGVTPNGGLVSDPAGNLYGTTSEESLVEGIGGTVFELSRTGALTVLYSFEGQTDSPTAGLVRDSSGNLYGPTVANVYMVTP